MYSWKFVSLFQNLQFDLTDNTCWLHLLAGEPWHVRKELGQADDDPYQVLQEKHLDIPTSWVLRLDVSLPGDTHK